MAGFAAQALDAFVVPGPEILDAFGLDPVAAGLRPVPNPRHASVLVLVGEVPPGLARAAAVVYSQQPRPRAILSIGAPSVPPLPAADVSVVASQAALCEGVAELRRRLALGAWDPDPPPFVIAESQTAEPASANDDEPHEHHAMSHGSDTADVQMNAMEHMHMGRGGFMSMVMMTRHLPRSADGLPMERLEVPFGPLFPGLPGGLNLVLTLDGDTIVRAVVRGGALRRDLAAAWPGPAETFPDRLQRVDPLSRSAFRILGWRALERATGAEPDERETRRRIAALERERIASHFSWLGRFGFLLGDAWLEHRAPTFAHAVRSALDPNAVELLREPVSAFVRRVQRTPLLARRLDGVARIRPESAHDVLGPNARACGRPEDARQEDPGYLALAFVPVVDDGCDARARLSVRLGEILQSLEIIRAAGTDGSSSRPKLAPRTGTGHAAVETPRGRASVTVILAEGKVVDLALEVPSSGHVHLVDDVAVGHELADGLLGLASLDLSPWELDR